MKKSAQEADFAGAKASRGRFSTSALQTMDLLNYQAGAGRAAEQTWNCLKPQILAGAMVLSVIAGYTDWRSRRIPNWLTVPGFVVGVALSTFLNGRSGLKNSLLGTGLAFALLLPFWLLRSLGAGDLKFAAALGAYMGPGRLVDILIGSVFVAGVMALALVIYKRRLLETIKNIGHILLSLITFRLPGSHVTIDNPNALTIPKGVALALTVVLYGVLWKLGKVC